MEPVQFRAEITLAKDKVLDVVACCDDVVAWAEQAGEVEVAFTVEATDASRRDDQLKSVPWADLENLPRCSATCS